MQVAIVDPKLVLAASKPGGTPPNLNIFNALIDTGATTTCISDRVVQESNLVPTGKVPMTGATGQSIVDQFAFAVGFMFNAHQTPTGELRTDTDFRIVQGCVFHNGGAVFDVLLGRDIICAGAFSLSFDGHFILSI